MKIPGTLILSRPDAIGDSVLTLAMAGWIKALVPGTRIIALVKEYTRPVWEHGVNIDAVVTLEELSAGDAAKQLRALNADAIVHVFPHREVARWAVKAGIPMRIGTSHRWWHWTTCNERVAFSRKRSDLHEAQLNIKLLAPFEIPVPATSQELVPYMGLRAPTSTPKVDALLAHDKHHVILHPNLVSGAGWGLKNYAELIRSIDPARWQVILTGTEKEAELIRRELPLELPHVTDASGMLELTELMALIGRCDALVAGSTGPLHLAAAMGRRAIGLYSMRRPIHPGRWAAIGRDAQVLVNDPTCAVCAAGKHCDCITRIPMQRVLEALNRPF